MDLFEIPPHIVHAADDLCRFFRRANVRDWTLSGAVAREPAEIVREALEEIALGVPPDANPWIWAQWRAQDALDKLRENADHD